MAETDQDTRARLVGLLAGIVRWVGLTAAVVLAIHVLLVVGDANPANWIARVTNTVANWVSLGFRDLFTKPADDPKLRTLFNYGLAALFWLVVSGLVSRLIRRLA
jgi:hypothetical protein